MIFKVTKIESGYNWNSISWTKYFDCNDKEVLIAVLKNKYGNLSQYHYDEESHITIEEILIETIHCNEINFINCTN